MQENSCKLKNSLKFSFFISILLSVFLGFAVYTIINMAGTALTDKLYMSHGKRLARQTEYFAEFQAYADRNNLSAADFDRIFNWSCMHGYVRVFICHNDTDNFDFFRKIAENNPMFDKQPAVKTVKFYDAELKICLVDNSEKYFYSLSRYFGIAFGLFTSAALIMRYFSKLIYRITRLNEKIEQVNSGELNRTIDERGNDEIAILSKSAENMRRSIIDYYEKEQKAYRSNTELMTSISHDIRTPLTSLLLYSDALADGKVNDSELIREYACICRDKAKQLKELTDTMFKYFLLFGKSTNPTLENYNASELIMQILGEQIFSLSQSGYDINTDYMENECVINTDAGILKRVFDNVFSNIRKYADKAKPITVSLSTDDKSLRISVINYISAKKDKKQSTNIGLKSSEKMMNSVGGRFDYWKSTYVFETLITIPKAKTE